MKIATPELGLLLLGHLWPRNAIRAMLDYGQVPLQPPQPLPASTVIAVHGHLRWGLQWRPLVFVAMLVLIQALAAVHHLRRVACAMRGYGQV